jgi:hypothetical protein
VTNSAIKVTIKLTKYLVNDNIYKSELGEHKMAKYEEIPIEEAKQISKRVRKQSAGDKYKKYITSLSEGKAGYFKIKDNTEGFRVRAGLKRAAESLGISIKIKKSQNEIVFWKE